MILIGFGGVGKSEMKRLKSVGDTWGTPLFIDRVRVLWWKCSTRACLPLRKLDSQRLSLL